MNYSSHYKLLIEKAKVRKLIGYKERHHIIPRCLGGTDDKDNIVELTAREHFIAHLLLVKIYPNSHKLIKAVAMMCIGQTERKFTNRLYGKFRELYREAMAECQKGDKNSQWGTKWIFNLELRKCVKISKTSNVPKGWNIGRVIDFDKFEKNVESKIKIKKLDIKKEQARNNAEELFHKYIDGNFTSIREFCKLGHYTKSHVSLTKLWKKYIPEYSKVVEQGKRFIPRNPSMVHGLDC